MQTFSIEFVKSIDRLSCFLMAVFYFLNLLADISHIASFLDVNPRANLIVFGMTINLNPVIDEATENDKVAFLTNVPTDFFCL